MGSADIEKYRRKCRRVIEFRYRPMVHAFDRRGRILDAVQSAFRDVYEHWEVTGATVRLRDQEKEQQRAIVVSHLRSSLIVEDVDDERAFLGSAQKLGQILREVFPERFDRATRVGFRVISVFESRGASNFDEVNRSIRRKFFAADLPTTLEITDCRAIFVHESGRVEVGPVREGEEWVERTFDRPKENVPRFGYGVDVDNYVQELDVGDGGPLDEAIEKLVQLNASVEHEIALALLPDVGE